MSDSKTKYNALEMIAASIINQSGHAQIDAGNITVMLSYNFWHESLSDMMSRGPNTSVDFLKVERERAFDIHGIKFIRGDK